MLTEFEALEKRVSVRAFEKRPVEGAVLEELGALIGEINASSGLRFQLVDTGASGKPAVRLSPGMFSGEVYACALLVGPEGELGGELTGYFGQRLMLRAVALGLGTCWVGGTFDRRSVSPAVGEGEKLWDVMPLGYAAPKTPLIQRTIRSRLRAKDRPVESFVESDHPFASLPSWIRAGAEAVRRGPSAVNRQPVDLVYKDGLVTMRLRSDKPDELSYNDLGIAKYQFQVGAEAAGVRGFWNFGAAGEFIPE